MDEAKHHAAPNRHEDFTLAGNTAVITHKSYANRGQRMKRRVRCNYARKRVAKASRRRNRK